MEKYNVKALIDGCWESYVVCTKTKERAKEIAWAALQRKFKCKFNVISISVAVEVVS